ncbi:MAG: amidase [Marinibacterium sp.]|nr:amidase [Marinibacterium sp.]
MLTRDPATTLSTRLQRRKLGAAELMQATLDRIDAVNGRVNAIVGLRDCDDLMRRARALDSGPVRGPLHGLPIAVKDLVNVAGLVSTQGSPAFAKTVPDRDDLIAARMREAGAILIGKTNVPEFGLGSHTFNPVYGATRNPYDTALSSGGSSGGAAVALATGMLALADGSDMMGSLRNPAGWNNVYSLRPSWGLVPAEPVDESFLHQLSTLGPMARSPSDLALLMDVIAGPEPTLPHGQPHAPIHPLGSAPLSGLRIGWLADWDGAYPMEPGILSLCEEALHVFSDLGAEVTSLRAPFPADALWDSWVTLRAWAVAASLGPLLDDGADIKDSGQWEIAHGRRLSAIDVHQASVTRSRWFRRAVALFDSYDALVLPTAQAWPFALDIPHPHSIAGVAMDTYHRWMEVMIPVSLAGLPAVTVPAGFGAVGLPMGLQIFGRRGADRRLLEIAATYHDNTGWPEKRPPI